ncbi:metallophosphoesterase [Nocardia camponoti]|uniref:3',5'-cyclic adenosine monophosphate phosphodiesterase CpdA n=1 Tax=Nocardia camponoti TaxID=1616106 RepID=A0A917QMU8_9NOCA|nr:metallophosphoesterase [Nocardia camponoti]GGK58239.1 3',5'-cyclic adenosine monophosphate phosphodiesterase CpdA [Nocardia camponoti]
MILAAQISDTHFDEAPRNLERAERAMTYLASLRRKPDVILVTGDITDSGKPAQYAQAAATLRGVGDIPVYFLPGNHDDRAAFRTALLDETPSTDPINGAYRVGPLTVLMLDSSVPGESSGRLADDTLDWLREALAETLDGPILLALHHPPKLLHSPIIDVIGLAEPETLADIIAADDRIVGTLTGHAHSAAASTFGGKPLITCPSTASVLGGVWEVEPPTKVMDYAPDPMVALHVIDETNSLTTHFRSVPIGGWLATPLA